jgi:hypothetical protein
MFMCDEQINLSLDWNMFAILPTGHSLTCSLRNDRVRCGDVTDMRTATTRVGAAFMVAAASVAVSQGTANAEPAGHQVRYTLTSATGVGFDLFYLTTQPPSKEAYDADAYAFVKSERVNVAAGVPWVFETTLADPQWAIITASTAVHAMQAPPNPHCEIAIDGQVAVQQDGPYTVQCKLGQW